MKNEERKMKNDEWKPASGILTVNPPSSFLAWLPFLWSRVLFPGRSAERTSMSRLRFALLLVIPGLLLYPAMAFHLFEPDEGRYAQLPSEMLERGEWIVPHLQGEPYLDKPPLVYWLVMCSYQVLGVSIWSARLVPALAVHLAVLAIYLLGRRSLGERAAWWGALLLALTPGFLGMGRLLILDGVLALWVTLSIFSAFEACRGSRLHRGWWLLAAVCCGLGVLTKGPIAALLLAPPLCLHLWLTKQGSWPGWRGWTLFAVVVALIALPWYIAVCLRTPFGHHFLWQHNVVRFLMPFDHGRPIWYYGPVLLLGLLPASALLIPFARFLGSGRDEIARQRSPELGFMLLAGGWCVLFFSLSGSKLPTYILPALPFLCLALGAFVASAGWDRSWLLRGSAAASFVLLAAASWVIVPEIADRRSPLHQSHLVVESCRDRTVPVVCYPRPVDSVAFHVGRSDFRHYRSKDTPALIRFLADNPRTVVLFSHRHSLQQLREVLPAELVIATSGPLGLCDLAVVERR
ncbi:MAG: phospholipid carrier-dependent glycosyltransferase [Planctomycetes bacterium]|nr:phospholipid carrier-dependent glycosyltransferase [Planctomycetota bacterium]